MTPREKLIENIVALINTTAILTIDDSCDGFPEPDLVNTDEIAEAIINYLKLEVVDIKGCGIKQFSDQMHCKVCGLTYDVNDPNEPLCQLESTKLTTIINIDNLI